MKTRAGKAGIDMAKAVIEMVNLMYQNKTAAHFYKNFIKVISKEMRRRNIPDTSMK